MIVSSPLRCAALMLVVFVLQLRFCAAVSARGCGDLDCSGTVTATDALSVLRIAVGETLVSKCSGSCEAVPPTSTTSTSTTTTLPPSPAAGGLIISEFMADPVGVADAVGEWFEIFNTGADAVDVRGLTIADDGSDFHRIGGPAPVLVAPGGSLLLARNADPAVNGGVTPDYVYDGFTLSNASDELVLMNGSSLIDRVAYGKGFVVRGRAASLDPASNDAAANDDPAVWCAADRAYGPGGAGTPGQGNPSCPAP